MFYARVAWPVDRQSRIQIEVILQPETTLKDKVCPGLQAALPVWTGRTYLNTFPALLYHFEILLAER